MSELAQSRLPHPCPFLGLGRALGETMAVTFVLGNAHDLSPSLLMPSNSIAAAIALSGSLTRDLSLRSSVVPLQSRPTVVTRTAA